MKLNISFLESRHTRTAKKMSLVGGIEYYEMENPAVRY